MIILDLNEDDLNKRLELGEVLHLKVEAIKAIWPGRYRLVLQDVSPLPGAEPTSYACHFCGLIGEALPDGSLPDGWAVKTFEKGAHIVCPECGDARSAGYAVAAMIKHAKPQRGVASGLKKTCVSVPVREDGNSIITWQVAGSYSSAIGKHGRRYSVREAAMVAPGLTC